MGTGIFDRKHSLSSVSVAFVKGVFLVSSAPCLTDLSKSAMGTTFAGSLLPLFPFRKSSLPLPIADSVGLRTAAVLIPGCVVLRLPKIFFGGTSIEVCCEKVVAAMCLLVTLHEEVSNEHRAFPVAIGPERSSIVRELRSVADLRLGFRVTEVS